MPALLHLVCHALLGAFAAWHHRLEPSLRQHTLGWPLWTVLAAAGALLVPTTTYQARMYPCHAAAYTLSPELQPELFACLGPITLALVLANLGALAAGFALARRSLNAGRTALVAILGCLTASTATLTAAATHERVFTFGTTHAFWDHRAAGFLDTPSAWAALAAYGACALVVRRASLWAQRVRAPTA